MKAMSNIFYRNVVILVAVGSLYIFIGVFVGRKLDDKFFAPYWINRDTGWYKVLQCTLCIVYLLIVVSLVHYNRQDVGKTLIPDLEADLVKYSLLVLFLFLQEYFGSGLVPYCKFVSNINPKTHNVNENNTKNYENFRFVIGKVFEN